MSDYQQSLKFIFKQLGLSEESASVYYEALKMGKATVQEIAKNAGVPRSSCYDILDRLKRIGLISSTKDGQKTYIVPEDPKLLQKILKKKEQKQKDALVHYKSIATHLDILGNRDISNKPDVRLYEGEANMKKVLMKMIKDAKGKELISTCLGDPNKEMDLTENPQYLLDYIEEATKYDVRERAILEDTKDNREYKMKFGNERHKYLLSPRIKNPQMAHIDKYICEDRIYFYNFEKNYSILIQDHFLAENERASFNVMWNALKKGEYKY